MKAVYVILTMILLSSGNLYAQNTACETIMNDGISLFNSGKYPAAKEKFEAAKKINCNNVQPWINKCNAKLTSQPQVKSAKQIECEQRFKDGKEAYDAGHYYDALVFFKKGLDDNCNNVDFQDYIDMCNMKLEKQQEIEQKNEACSKYFSDGKNAYDAGDYTIAKSNFQSGLASNCNNANFQQCIALCDNRIACQNATLSVTPTEIEFDASGGSKTIYITANYSWTNSSVLSWLSINKYSSSITLTCNANTSTSDRADYFTITAGSKSVRINIKQKGQATALNLTEINRLIFWNINSNSTYSWDNGDRYKGQKNSDGSRSGLGAYYWNSGTIYFGSFSNNLMDGYGICISLDGSHTNNCPNSRYYVGNWSNGQKSGKGTCYDETGKLIYYGDFSNDKPTDTYPSSGLSSYKFEIIKSNGDDFYLGETKDGSPQGQGIYIWGNGGMWYGEWKDGKRAGYGIYIFLSGSITTGYWTGDTYSSTK